MNNNKIKVENRNEDNNKGRNEERNLVLRGESMNGGEIVSEIG